MALRETTRVATLDAAKAVGSAAPISVLAPGLSSMEPADRNPRKYYRPELDVVRFSAFLLVFLHHVLPDAGDPRLASYSRPVREMIDAVTNACGFGLSLFFTLSAFLICELLILERKLTGTVSVKQFYIRRILRIWPLYYLGLLLFGVAYSVCMHAFGRNFVPLCWFAVFLGAWRAAFFSPMHNPANPLWSISVEEQFYAFAPFCVKRLSRRQLVIACTGVFVAAILWLTYVVSTSMSDKRIWFDPLVHFQCFAAGIGLCLFLNGRLPHFNNLHRVFILATACGLFLFSTFALHARFHALPFPGTGKVVLGYGTATVGTVLF